MEEYKIKKATMLVAQVEDIGFEPITFPQQMRDALAAMEEYKIKRPPCW
jgi:hypothetical protein